MKKRFFTVLTLLLATVVGAKGDDVVLRIQLGEGKTLAEQLEVDAVPDSIVVTGEAETLSDLWHYVNTHDGVRGVNLHGVTLPGDVLPETMLHSEVSLKNVTLPANLKELGRSAFYSAWSLEHIDLPSTLVRISDFALTSCKNLKQLTLPDGLEEIGTEGLEGLWNIHELALPSSLRLIGTASFNGLLSITHLSIPSGIEEIPLYAFNDCISLETLELGSGVKTIGVHAFRSCSKLRHVAWPPQLERIGFMAFTLSKIDSLVLPPNVHRVDAHAFSRSHHLRYVDLPAQVDTLSETAFNWCESLEKIVCRNPVPPVVLHLGQGDVDTSKVVLCVPAGTSELYRRADGWGRFAHIEELPTIVTVLPVRTVDQRESACRYRLDGKAVRGGHAKGLYIEHGRKLLMRR